MTGRGNSLRPFLLLLILYYGYFYCYHHDRYTQLRFNIMKIPSMSYATYGIPGGYGLNPEEYAHNQLLGVSGCCVRSEAMCLGLFDPMHTVLNGAVWENGPSAGTRLRYMVLNDTVWENGLSAGTRLTELCSLSGH